MANDGWRPTGRRRGRRAGGTARALTLFLALTSPAAAVAANYTWTGGGGADTNWSNAANWGGAGPSDNEVGASLTFPELAGHYDSHNDLSGLRVTFLSITTQLSAGDYTFSGNPIRLEGPSTLSSPGTGNPNLVWQIPLDLGANVTVAASGRQTRLEGDIRLVDHTLTFNVGGDIVVDGVISGIGNIVKNNTSALTIRGSNTYAGTTTGNNGALYIAGPDALGDPSGGTTIAGGVLGFTPGSAFTLTEPLVFDGGGIGAYGTPTITGSIKLNTAINITAFDPAATLTLAGDIGGGGGFNKAGPGLVRLSGTGTYGGGTSVAAGALQLDGSLTGAATTTVKSGATLTGSGSTGGPISVETGGTLAPGDSPGALACGGLSMVAGATLAVEITGPTPVSEYDQLTVDGPVSLGGATLSVTLAYVPAEGQTFTVIAQRQAQGASGTFADLPEGGSFALEGRPFAITYLGGGGHDVVLIASPGDATPTPVGESPTPSPTPTATNAPGGCTGDCDGDGAVGINELVTGVNIALGNDAVDSCSAFDADDDGAVAIQELIAAVNNALGGCR